MRKGLRLWETYLVFLVTVENMYHILSGQLRIIRHISFLLLTWDCVNEKKTWFRDTIHSPWICPASKILKNCLPKSRHLPRQRMCSPFCPCVATELESSRTGLPAHSEQGRRGKTDVLNPAGGTPSCRFDGGISFRAIGSSQAKPSWGIPLNLVENMPPQRVVLTLRVKVCSQCDPHPSADSRHLPEDSSVYRSPAQLLQSAWLQLFAAALPLCPLLLSVKWGDKALLDTQEEDNLSVWSIQL